MNAAERIIESTPDHLIAAKLLRLAMDSIKYRMPLKRGEYNTIVSYLDGSLGNDPIA